MENALIELTLPSAQLGDQLIKHSSKIALIFVSKAILDNRLPRRYHIRGSYSTMHSKQYTAAGATAGYIHIDNGVLVLYSRLVRCASSRD